MKGLRRSLYIKFICPTTHKLRDKKGEYYNPHTQICYIFHMLAEPEPDEKISEYLIQCINHAQLHYIIQMIEGTSKSYKFDNVAKIIRKRDKEIYEKLF